MERGGAGDVDETAGSAPDAVEQPGVLQPHLDALPAQVPAGVAPLIEELRASYRALRRRERRIVFVGALKAGKSSLLNALLGAPLLPVRANRATGVVTALHHGDRPEVTVVRRSANGLWEEEVPFDRLAAAIALDPGGGGAQEPEGVEEVRIGVPHPLLRGGVLVDTPGLLESERLTDRVFRELARADLAVMVLSADKILSARERETAMHIDGALNGNLIYALNRLDLVDAEDREEVIGWARTALEGSGNDLVGRPRIFPLSARGRADLGLTAFREWLEAFRSTPPGDRIAVLSRLGAFEQILCAVAAALQVELRTAQEETQAARAAAEASLVHERTQARERIARDRLRLRACREALAAIGDHFVAECVEGTRRQIERSRQPPATVKLAYEPALERFAREVSEAARSSLLDAPVTVPPFELKQWILHAEVAAAMHPAGELGALFGGLVTRVVDGGNAGREAGASIGGWIGKNVFGVDAERETLKRVDQVARGVVPALREEAERYLERVDGLLAEADRFYATWTRTSSRVLAAEDAENQVRELGRWCDGFLDAVRALAARIATTPKEVC
ncbi:MAG: dynamin family protein [Chloroflexi bacterium]|nr:dynamin family protein [Chloroflexota bacterium]